MSNRPKRKKAAARKREAGEENRATHSRYRAKKWAKEHGTPPRTRQEQQRQAEGS